MSVKISVPELKKTPFFVEATVRNTQSAIKFMNTSSSFFANAERLQSEFNNLDDDHEMTREEIEESNEQMKAFGDLLGNTLDFVENTLKLSETQENKLLDMDTDALIELGTKVATSVMNGNTEPDKTGLNK